MTERQLRENLTKTAIEFMLDRGQIPEWHSEPYNGHQLLLAKVDTLGGVWFYLKRWDKFIGMIDTNKQSVYVRKGSVYTPLFEAYAERNKFKLRKPKALQIRGNSYTADYFTSIAQHPTEPEAATDTGPDNPWIVSPSRYSQTVRWSSMPSIISDIPL